MDRLVFIASATAARLETAQAVAANNLANASTAGFKADLLASRAALRCCWLAVRKSQT